MKQYCIGAGSIPAEVRPYSGITNHDTLGQCGKCGRILKVTPSGRLRPHSVRGKNTTSHDRTMEILWDSARRDSHGHFAIGLPVYVRQGATPAGWEDLASPGGFVPDHWRDEDYFRTFQIQSVGDDGTFEVMGWFWYPEDLVSA